MRDLLTRFRTVMTLVLLPTGLITGCATTSNQEVMFQAMVDKPADRIEIQRERDATTFLVTSPSGIGAATITLWQGDWPSDVRVRLRYVQHRPFMKVEGFTCAIGDKRPVEVTAITYTPNYAEVTLPPEVLRSRGGKLLLQWVDYYR